MIGIDISTNYGKIEIVSLGKKTLPERQDESWYDYTKNCISKQCNVEKANVKCMEQIHGRDIIYMKDYKFWTKPLIGDGIISCNEEDVLAIRTADCLPLLIWSYDEPWIAALHIGWKGAKQGILDELLKTFTDSASQYGYYIGPYIRGESYEVGLDVGNLFSGSVGLSPSLTHKKDKFQLDLGKIVHHRIREAFPKAVILDVCDDTFGSDQWFSHRSGDLGRNLHAIRFFALSEKSE